MEELQTDDEREKSEILAATGQRYRKLTNVKRKDVLKDIPNHANGIKKKEAAIGARSASIFMQTKTWIIMWKM